MQIAKFMPSVALRLIATFGLFFTTTAAAIAPQLLTTSLPIAAVGHPYRADIVVAGSNSATLSGLPTGLAVANASAGILTLSGTPAAAGKVVISITAKNVDGELAVSLPLFVKGDAFERPLTLATGAAHACAISPSGVWCWGANDFGQIGDGTANQRGAPVNVLTTNQPTNEVRALALGASHSCALVAQQLYCWGGNDSGQLGLGNKINQNQPSLVPLQNVTALAAGDKHTCAVVEGGVLCWGENAFGQLGNGTKTGQLLPVRVLPSGSGVTMLAAGNKHTCAKVNGGVMCWGSNSDGQLGKSAVSEALTPISVIPTNSGVTAMATGANHSCAAQSGALFCWGDNRDGQLGVNANPVTLPTRVPSGANGISAISAGAAHTCVIKAGVLACMGKADNGRIGYVDPPIIGLAQPLQQIGTPSGLAVGNAFSCAIVGLVVRCWGSNDRGQLGDNGGVAVNQFVLTLPNGVGAVSAGGDHACAIVDGGVQCWGDNSDGQLGVANTASANTSRFIPVPTLPATSAVTAVSVGNFHTCALRAGGVQCWGLNEDGQLGDKTRVTKQAPVQTIPAGSSASALALGGFHTCAIVAGGVKCWGFNDFGQLGDGTLNTRAAPVDVIAAGSDVTAITAGAFHTCAIQSGRPRCWGRNSDGQLGDATSTNRLIPTEVHGILSAVAISAGGYHTCFASAITVACAGYNFSGQLGDGSTVSSIKPVLVLGLSRPAERLFSGLHHSCAILAGGGLACWGENLNGQLGDGTRQPALRARNVFPVGVDIQSGAAGFAHTCITVAKAVLCTGASDNGQLGTLESAATRFSILNFPAAPVSGLKISNSGASAFVGQEVIFNVQGVPANARGAMSLLVNEQVVPGCPQLAEPVAEILQCRYTFQTVGTFRVGIQLSASETQPAATAALPSPLVVAPVIKGNATALFRTYNSVLRAHLLTSDANEYDKLGKLGWAGDASVGRVLDADSTILGVATVPVYRLYNVNLRRHLYTTNAGERLILRANGWQEEGIVGYAALTDIAHPSVKLLPLYRLYAAALRAHLLTTDANEAAVLSQIGIWTNEGPIGYVLK